MNISAINPPLARLACHRSDSRLGRRGGGGGEGILSSPMAAVWTPPFGASTSSPPPSISFSGILCSISAASPSCLFSHEGVPRSRLKSGGVNRSFFSVSAAPFDFSPPPIDHDVVDSMTIAGAKVSEDGVIETYDNDDEALDAADDGVAVVDLSHFGRVRVSGEDRVSFLHNQSTANFECLHEGEGCDTVFVSPTARTVDIAHAWIMRNAITLVVSSVTCRSLVETLNKYIFFADKVGIQDITKQTCFFVLLGSKSSQVMEHLNLGDLVGQAYGSHKHYSVNGMPVTVGVGSLISKEGFSLLMSPATAASVWDILLSCGANPMGSLAWERLRILRGRPAPGKELTKEFNVLETGLWSSISLDKGCYKGQETISRLITYDGVKQSLWGLHLSAQAEPESPIMLNGKKVGKLTSCTLGRKESEYFGLGYIKRQAASEGSIVVVGDGVTGKVVRVPFLANQLPPPPVKKSIP